jgi:hypothetical protein
MAEPDPAMAIFLQFTPLSTLAERMYWLTAVLRLAGGAKFKMSCEFTMSKYTLTAPGGPGSEGVNRVKFWEPPHSGVNV